MEKPLVYDGLNFMDSTSLIHKIYNYSSDGLHFMAPNSNLKTNEGDVVRGILQMLQGFSSPLFKWDLNENCFCAKSGVYVAHLSRTSLHTILSQFRYAATCLQLVDSLVNNVKTPTRSPPPTLKAFVTAVSSWVKRLRDVSLKEEMKISNSNGETTPSLLGLANSLSSLCSGAEFLLEIVHGAIPPAYFEPCTPVPASEIAVHVLDYLYKRLDEACLVQGGEEEAYQMLLHLFVGSVLPYIQGLDSWLYEGILNDPFQEMFFYANNTISVEDPDFWEKRYLLRRRQHGRTDAKHSVLIGGRDHVPLTGDRKETGESFVTLKGKELSDGDYLLCPIFIKDTAKSIISAGKSLQLIQHVSPASFISSPRKSDSKDEGPGSSFIVDGEGHTLRGRNTATLTLSETFCISVAGLIGHGDHISRYYLQDDSKCKIFPSSDSCANQIKVGKRASADTPISFGSGKIWYKFLTETLSQKRESSSLDVILNANSQVLEDMPSSRSFCPENPVTTVCQSFLDKNMDAWKSLNISKSFYLPPLNDNSIWNAIFGEESQLRSSPGGMDFAYGFQFGDSGRNHAHDDREMLEALFPFPTILPSFQEDLQVSALLPFQNNSTLPSKVLAWIQDVEPGNTTLPLAVIQECLGVYIKRQVDCIGKKILSKLMHDWRLMDELAVLRSIYLLGSGDLLQRFLTVIFDKLDRRETLDDDFDLNSILQESIRNSADGSLLSAPDSLVVSITSSQSPNFDDQNNNATSSPQKNYGQRFGIDGLDSLTFSYKVSWPLELIANTESIKKYNQIMRFLLKVKRAKFVLDKARRWMWKGKKAAVHTRKNHWLVEQKLLQFVDAFHQYVMDRVYHSAWLELCEGMAAAQSLDEVMEVHEAYLLSIQRQCFVVPDKLWALIASRINSILGLALDFYSIQQTLSSGGAVSTIRARCEVEVERIDKQFDECIAFLLRVLSFKLNVGHFPHLADLVTRINYNYFYMSESGNLKTTGAATAETLTSRLGKAFS